jgi:phosphoserine phosphatase
VDAVEGSVGVRRWSLVVCDLDGTLIVGTSAARHLDRWIGRGDLIAELDGPLAAGQLTNTQVAERYASAYRGLSLEAASRALSDVPCLDDIASGVALLQTAGVDAVIATAGWSFGARALASTWGFSDACGVDLEVDEGTGLFTGRVNRHLEPEDKVTFVEEHCGLLGSDLSHVVAVGDGASDLPLFEAVGFSVALNASPDARSVADAVVDSRSFLDVLAAVPGLLPRSGTSSAGGRIPS